MRFILSVLCSFLLLLGIAQSSALAALSERTNTKPTYSKTLTVTKILKIFKCHSASASAFCSSYLHYNNVKPKTVTKTRTSTKKVVITKTSTAKTTRTVVDCTVVEPYTYDTTTLFVGPATTITELRVVATSISLVFGGPIISAEDKKKVKRNLKYPTPTLSHAHPSSLSAACSSFIGRKPAARTFTKTITKTTTKTSTTTKHITKTITASSCKLTLFPFVLATETGPSKTFFSQGFKTVTASTTTETIAYFCWPLGLGCARDVPTPCCPGTCESVSGWGQICVPTDPAEKEAFLDTL